MRWEEVQVEMTLSVDPERNPQLDLPERLTTRRGFACGPRGRYLTNDDFLALELQVAMRGLRHALERGGYLERDEPPKRCGCDHHPHPGFVCGHPLPHAEAEGRPLAGITCGCEG